MNVNWSDELHALDRVEPSRDLWADALARATPRRRGRLRIAAPRTRLALVVVAIALVTLTVVPIGGASLGARAVHGIDSLLAPPPNQQALDRAADDARSIVGGAYYTAYVVDAAANRVHLYLAHAPQSIIDELNAAHPGTYDIHNDAAHPLSELLRVQRQLVIDIRTASVTLRIDAASPTRDGHLKVGIEGHDVQDAQSALDAKFGTGIFEVFGGIAPMFPVVHSDAARPLGELRRIQRELTERPIETASGTVRVLVSEPTLHGHLIVWIEGHNVQEAQAALDAKYGTGVIIKVCGEGPPYDLGFDPCWIAAHEPTIASRL
jgi:hypothetical protein